MQSNKIISFLVLLSVVQTALILYLILADTRTNPEIIYAESPDHEESRLASNNSGQVNLESAASFEKTSHLGESQLRNIIRQEISALKQSSFTLTNERQSESFQNENSEVLIDAVNEQFDIFIASGGISSNDMESFYYQVSKLPKEERSNAMKRFARSINSGEIRVTQ